ncbi:MAG: phosphatidate cytidylyltransferase [Candidatus Aminicenantes bacterium]|nr:phosphatidate cytidylyltransferase [Candidatus Aminicenantes bacterium]
MEFHKRLPTAIVLIGLAFVTIHYAPDWIFFCVVQLLVLAALWELYKLVWDKGRIADKIMGSIIALLLAFSFYFDFWSLGTALYSSLLILAFYFVFSINRNEKLALFPSTIALLFFGAVYLSFTLNFFNLIRTEYGPYPVYFLLAVIFVGDTGALLVGRLVGKHKMAPIASPRKTWEGSFGGIVLAVATGGAMQLLFLHGDALLGKSLLLAFLIHVAAQVSDPFESLFKRAVGVKDSSNILPGHGGFLDRLDSLILAAPLFYFLLKYIGMR